MDDDETVEAVWLLKRSLHAEVATERVADGAAALDPELCLEVAEKARQRRGRVAMLRSGLRVPAAGQVGGVDAEARAQRLEQVAPRVARSHQPVDQEQRRGRLRPEGHDPGAQRPECRRLDQHILGTGLPVGMGQSRALRE